LDYCRLFSDEKKEPLPKGNSENDYYFKHFKFAAGNGFKQGRKYISGGLGAIINAFSQFGL
jgi:hypothetical protein